MYMVQGWGPSKRGSCPDGGAVGAGEERVGEGKFYLLGTKAEFQTKGAMEEKIVTQYSCLPSTQLQS